MEAVFAVFPHHGSKFSTAWKPGLIALGALAAAAGGAWGAEEAAAPARAAYDAGDMEGALAVWEAMAEEGVDDPDLWYDQGNALYRLGRYPEAIRMYLRARRGMPRDPDAEYNLGLAAQAAGVELPARGAAERWLGGLSAAEWRWVAEGGFWALVLMAAAAVARPGWREKLGTPAAVAAVALLAGAAGLAWPAWEGRKPQCVVGGERAVVARSAPLEGSAELVALEPGTVVRKVGEHGFWAEVEAGEARGWVEGSVLLPVAREK